MNREPAHFSNSTKSKVISLLYMYLAFQRHFSPKIWNNRFLSSRFRGGSWGGSNEPPLEPKLFHFLGEFQEKLVKLYKSNPPQLIWTPGILDPPLFLMTVSNLIWAQSLRQICQQHQVCQSNENTDKSTKPSQQPWTEIIICFREQNNRLLFADFSRQRPISCLIAFWVPGSCIFSTI